MNTNGDTIQIEIRQLPISCRAQINSPINAKSEEVHELRIIGMINRVGESLPGNH
ncbi:hypothetical protein SDC9_181972 [bioreactor metagenome]|uniref:Uncharacterized protein n=1 Tax=bioreactor metagenome TaxID=1076179 RepID=A0A645H656_9ZZZZ